MDVRTRDQSIRVYTQRVQTNQIGGSNRLDRSNSDWLQQWVDHYRARMNDMCEAIEDLDDIDKLG